MKGIVGLALACGASAAAAGALQECLNRAADPASVLSCLRQARDAANVACETDLLRQRASALERLDVATNRL